MKILRYITLALAAMAAAMVACEELPNGEGNAQLDVEITSLTLPAEAGITSFDITSNTEWSISCSADWMQIIPTSGSGSTRVLCSYSANTTAKGRNTKIEIMPVDLQSASSHTVLVLQNGTSGGNADNGGDDNGDDNGDNGGGLVTDGGTPHAGWAELPAEQDNSDYYYAYHMRPDKTSQRNLAICYSASKACPVWVAAVLHSCYKGSADRSSYSPDPQIPSSIQAVPGAGNTNKGNWMNRGHMLASNKRTVSSATNKQVFYYTNIAPQNGNTLNTSGGLWNNLEDHENKIMCADTLYSVHGCHWENTNERFNDQVVPTHFYKVYIRTKKGNSGKWVVNCSASELQCVAFYMRHDVEKCQPSSKHMISVAELERITGQTFFPNVPNAPKDTYNPSDWGL